MYGARRTLDAAFAASLVLHAGLLFALADTHPIPRLTFEIPPIVARLAIVSPEQPVEVKQPAEAQKPKKVERPPEPVALAPRPAVKKPTPAPQPVVEKAPEPAPQPTEPVAIAPVAPPVPAPVREAPAEPVVPALQSPQPLAAARPSPPPDPNRLDPETLAQYRFAIIAAAGRHKLYPRAALDNNWEGRVEVRMVVGKDGAIASLDVKSSAGYEILDAQAVDMIRRAWPDTPLPSGLRGREFSVDVPVVFELRDPRA